jgi:hypothetical protein
MHPVSRKEEGIYFRELLIVIASPAKAGEAIPFVLVRNPTAK